jgi:predicted amino acid dehydrogenase
MGIAAMKKAASEVGIDLSRSKLGIIGATGNIAATYALMMAGEVAELTLIVRDPASPRLKTLMNEIHRAVPHLPVRAVDDLDALRACSLIVAASNAPEPLIYPESLPPGPVVICDISLPSDVAPAVSLERPEALVIHGGLVRLPCNDDFLIAGLPLDAGYVYACMAETLLMGLEGIQSHGSYGPITPSDVEKAMAMAERHGFTLGQLKTEWAY